MNGLNFWDDYSFGYLTSLKNQTYKWNGPDNGETYKKVSNNRSIVTYEPSDFSYVRNSQGFRSQEFDNDDKVKILYAGCSFTEGVGLPIEHTWCGFLNQFIQRDLSLDRVNMYNIGYGGFSIDATIRFTYLTIKNGVFNPDMVMILLPPLSRTEIFYEDSKQCVSIYHFISAFEDSADPKLKKIRENLLNSFSPIQKLHETFRSLLFLKEFLKNRGIPLFFNTWDEIKMDFTRDNFISFGKALLKYTPDDLKDNLIYQEFLLDDDPANKIKLERPFKQTIARDGMHPGPNAHWNYAKGFYAKLKTKDEFIKVAEKWK